MKETEKKFRVTPAASRIYSNISGLTVSSMDFKLDFAEAMADGSCKTVAGVILSPEHASALMMMLLDQLITFERQVGPIRNDKWIAFTSQTRKPFSSTKQRKEGA